MNQVEEKFDVAIVGLGPVGSLLALFLNKAGLSVMGIDRDRDIFPLPRAVTINDEGLRIIQKIGLEDVYLENSTVIDGAEFINSEHERIGEALEAKDLITKNAWNPIRFFHQPIIDKKIRKRLMDTGKKIFLEENLINIEQKEENILIKTQNVKTNEKSYFTSKFLVGADGGSSTVGKLLSIEREDLDYNREWVVVDVKLKEQVKMSNMAAQICDPKRLATYIPGHFPYKRWEFLILDDEDRSEMEKKETIHELLDPWLKPDQYTIIRSAIYQFHSVLAKNFRINNCFLIGDAAHQTPPFMGEGMMTGYRDVANLTWKIALALKEKDSTHTLLNSYQIERKPHARFILENSAAIGKLMEAYANTKNPEDVPLELVKTGYGSFVIPPLNKGIFYSGVAIPSMKAGTIFPQPTLINEDEIVERKDYLFGDGFAIVSNQKVLLTREEENFYKRLNTKMVVLDQKLINQNKSLIEYMAISDIFVLRPDRYIFGATSDNVSFQDITNDLRKRLGIE